MESINRTTPGFSILVGKPASGKTYLLNYLLMLDHPDYNKDPFRYGVVFTTTKFNRHYESLLPAEYVHSKYQPEVLQNLLDIQASTEGKHRAFVIFDDCLDQKGFASQLFTNLSTCYRHYKLDIFILTQYVYKIPPVVRECSTRVAVFRTTTKRSIEALYESFGAFFDNYVAFSKYILDNTGDYQFVWYIANSSAESIDDIYHIKKCPENVPKYRFEY